MNAEDLLSGPRGRRLCFEYASSESLRHAVTETCTRAMYWQEPEPEDVELTRDPGLVRAVAEAIARHPGTAWWHDPVDVAAQRVVDVRETTGELSGRPPMRTRDEMIEREHGVVAGLHAPDEWPDSTGERWRTTRGYWWSTPSATTQSSRSDPDDGFPLGIDWEEDAPGYEVADAWSLEVSPHRQVYEIGGPADWVDLVRRYPHDVSSPARRGDWWRTTGRDGDWAIPNWAAVVRDLDGVHLTVSGYLTTAGRALEVDDRLATVLAGWPPDTTYWFTDELTVSAEPARWLRDADGDWRRS